jgi:soluble lytic murein transglycosylase-like protein
LNTNRSTWVFRLTLVASLFGLTAQGSEMPGAAWNKKGNQNWTPAVTTSVPTDSAVAAYAERYAISRHLSQVIYEQSIVFGIEPAVVFGLIAIESAFNSRAVGRHGALGLMQIKPSTARIYDRRVTSGQLLRPEVNVRLGLRHLKREVEYFDDLTLGLLAYNMGRARLSRALERGRVPRTGYAAKVLAHCEDPCT